MAAMMSELHLEYDPSKLEIVSISQGFLPKWSELLFLHEINTDSGVVQINTTVLMVKITRWDRIFIHRGKNSINSN